jgi:3'-5' exoribonuclease
MLFKGAVPTEGGRRRGPAWKSFRRGAADRKRRREVPPALPAGAREETSAETTAGEQAGHEEPGAERRPPAEGRPHREDRPRREDRPPREGRPPRERPGREDRRGPRPERAPKPEQKLVFRPFAALVEAAAPEVPATGSTAPEAAPPAAPEQVEPPGEPPGDSTAG